MRLPPVDFGTEPERDALTEMLHSYFGKRTRTSPAPDRAGPVDRHEWRALGADLGVLGLGVPAEAGGAGGSLADSAVLGREAGRAGSQLPVLSLAPVTTLLAAGGDELLGAVVSGTTLVGIAGLAPAAAVLVTATLGAARHARIDGRVPAVLAGASADTLLVVAQAATDRVVVAVEAGASGHSAREAESLDLTRQWSEHTFDAVPGRVVLPPEQASVLAGALDVARVAAAADLVGIAEAALHDAVEYAKVRFQFGRAIGSQQAIKHRSVDLSIAVERAAAALDYAVGAPLEARRQAALVALTCATQTAVEVTSGAIQIFGGIGMTWEHPAHLRLRRALADQAAFGTPQHHRREIAQLLWPVPGA
jgi:alkylation response protein AidB-like acyl-CoA dehydrogenase